MSFPSSVRSEYSSSRRSNRAQDGEDFEREIERDRWASHVQYLLSCIGYTVGLGNVWRFPYVAFENGGAAFLFPYICCNILFGMPLLYFEMSLGQYLQAGPNLVYFKLKPVLQGIGWSMTMVSLLISMYYNVIISWIGLYLVKTYWVDEWATCGHAWNNDACTSLKDNLKWCMNDTMQLAERRLWFRGDCVEKYPNTTLETATEQYFMNQVLNLTTGLDDFGNMNWDNFMSLCAVWVIEVFILWKGVQLIGKASLITTTIPYFIIGIIFWRGLSLPGAYKGIKFYILEPDMSKLLDPKTWKAALAQVCFSLSLGMGGLQAMASYNERSHNCLRDAVVVAGADIFMSLFGGVAVFSVVGSLAHAKNVKVEDAIASGQGLAFIAYPEALSRMDGSLVWCFIFFLMLFCLGLSTQFVYIETLACGVLDQWPHLYPMRPVIILLIALVEMIPGVLMCTGSGMYWLNLWDTYTSSVALCLACVAEVIGVIFIYGWQNFRHDLETMFGQPLGNFQLYLGNTGYYFFMSWMVIAPAGGVLMTLFSLMAGRTSIGDEGQPGYYLYPIWSEVLGWFFGLLPVLFVPGLAIWHITAYRTKGNPAGAFRVHESHPSYARMKREAENGMLLPGIFDSCLNGSLDVPVGDMMPDTPLAANLLIGLPNVGPIPTVAPIPQTPAPPASAPSSAAPKSSEQPKKS